MCEILKWFFHLFQALWFSFLGLEFKSRSWDSEGHVALPGPHSRAIPDLRFEPTSICLIAKTIELFSSPGYTLPQLWFLLVYFILFFFFIRNDSLSPQYVLNKRQNWITVAEWRHLFLIWVSGKNLPLAIMASMRFPALLASSLRVYFPGTLGESPEHRHFYQSSAACKILEKKNVQG